MMTSSEHNDREGESVSSCTQEDLAHSFEVVLKDLPEVLLYIKRLNDHIKKQQDTMIKLYEKLKEYKLKCATMRETPSCVEASTQTEWEENLCVEDSAVRIPLNDDEMELKQPSPRWGTADGQGAASSLADEVKQAAESAMQQTGFVYEETSGMYYDYNTGYYYNAELGLYYDGQRGCYVYYSEETKTYEYHSDATVSPAVAEMQHPEETVTPAVAASEVPTQDVAHFPETYTKLYEEVVPDVESELHNSSHHKHRRKSKKSKGNHKKRKAPTSSENEDSIEEGECSDSSSVSLDENEAFKEISQSDKRAVKKEISTTKKESSKSMKRRKSQDDVSKGPAAESNMPTQEQKFETTDEASNAWPPCMRIIVQSTELPKLAVGTLFIVTCTGGTLGREKGHEVCIPDINISKHHGVFTFNEADGGKYYLTDYGSRNGTYVDNKRLSAAKQESEPCEIAHGSVVTLGTTQLLCHIHPGRETCEDCEPGVVAAKFAEEIASSIPTLPRGSLVDKRKQELRRLRMKFGFGNNEFRADGQGETIYEDRAEIRRQTIGSQNEFAKTETASTSESIKSSNKGFKMLEKMGWSKGQSLGKDGTGLKEPVHVEQRAQHAGLGSDVPVVTVDHKAKKKADLWMRTQKRFGQLRDSPLADEADDGDED